MWLCEVSMSNPMAGDVCTVADANDDRQSMILHEKALWLINQMSQKTTF